MKAKDIKTKNEGDLTKLIGEARESLRTFRFGEAGSRTRNVRAARGFRKTVARALTELASRRLNA
jgi:ribosomal protein L29